ncbi:MAG: SusE domain-containing protein, partial [Flavisolibacter sp.]
MKNKSLILFLLLLVGFAWSCTKKENKVYLEGSTPPVLKSSINGNIPLDFTTKDQEAIRLSWTNPNYVFTTGVSSQNVSYLVEIDTTGSNFTNPQRKTLSISNDQSISISQNDLNDYLLNQLQLNTTMTHNLEIRVTASLANGTVPVASNVLKFTAKPYAIPPKVAPPASGKLFITGSATPKSWMSGGDPEVPSQEFTQVSPTFYRIDHITLNGGGSYLFVPVYGDWGAKYGGTGANNTNNVN